MHLWKRKEKNPISAGWCCTLAPGIRNFNEVGCAWACCTGSPADLGGVGSRKINTEVGQLQNCSASVWCAKKLGDNCIVGVFFGKEKETPLALVLLYITYSWVLLKIEPRCSYQPTVGLRPECSPWELVATQDRDDVCGRPLLPYRCMYAGRLTVVRRSGYRAHSGQPSTLKVLASH